MRKVARNALFAGAGQTVAKSALLLLVLAVANFLGAATLGEAMTGFTLATFLRNFLDWGLGKVAVRHVSRNPTDAASFLASALLSKRSLVVLGLLGFAAASAWFAWISPTRREMAVFLALMGGAQVVGTATVARGYVFNGLERMDLETGSLAARQGTMLAASSGFLFLGLGLPGIGLGVLAGEVAGRVVSARGLRRLGVARAPGDPERARAVRRAGNPIVLGILCGLVYAYGNTLIIRSLLGAEATGLFNAPYRMVLEFQVLPAVLGAAAFPVFARLGDGKRGDIDGLLSRARKTAACVLTVGLLGAGLLSVFAREALRLLYWKQPAFWEMDALLVVLAWAIPVTCLNVLLGDVLYALDGERTALAIAATVAGASLAANLVAIPRWGLWGACWTTLGAETLFLLLDVAAVRVLARRTRRGGA